MLLQCFGIIISINQLQMLIQCIRFVHVYQRADISYDRTIVFLIFLCGNSWTILKISISGYPKPDIAKKLSCILYIYLIVHFSLARIDSAIDTSLLAMSFLPPPLKAPCSNFRHSKISLTLSKEERKTDLVSPTSLYTYISYLYVFSYPLSDKFFLALAVDC